MFHFPISPFKDEYYKADKLQLYSIEEVMKVTHYLKIVIVRILVTVVAHGTAHKVNRFTDKFGSIDITKTTKKVMTTCSA